MAKKITYLKCHQTVFVPGLGTLGDTLPGPKTVPGLEMELEGEHVLIKGFAIVPGPNGMRKGDLVRGIVPLANVIVASYEEAKVEVAKPAAVAKEHK